MFHLTSAIIGGVAVIVAEMLAIALYGEVADRRLRREYDARMQRGRGM